MEMTAVTEQPPRDDELRRFLPWLDERTQQAPAPQPAAPAPAAEGDPAERRRTEKLARALAHIRRQRRRLRRHTLISMTGVVLISGVITWFGSDNAHNLLVRHHTPSGGAWMLYPALEAALIVEIQIGGVLAEYRRRVAFWGATLRIVTAVGAVTLCAAGPGELGDPWGACYHALGPIVQFCLAEFLAESRAEFKGAADDLVVKEEGQETASRPADERRTKSAGKRTAKNSSAPRPRPDGRTRPADEPTSTPAEPSVPVDDDDLLVRAHAAADELARTDQRLNRDNLVRAIRAGGGTIQNKDAGRILAQVRAERGGPELHPVREKGA